MPSCLNTDCCLSAQCKAVSCRGHSVSHFTNYLIGPTFQCVAETEFIKANAAENDDILAGAEIRDPAAANAEQACRQQVFAALTNVVKDTFFQLP